MKRTTVNPKTIEMALTAILVAIALVMAFTDIGYPMIGIFEIALIIIPVAIGSVTLGWKAGLIMGTIFGVTSFMIAAGIGLHPNPFATFLFNENPFYTAIICIVPRLICGVTPALIYKAISKKDKKGFIAIPVACMSAAIINTILFLGGVWLFFSGPIGNNNDYFTLITGKYGNFNFITFFLVCAGLSAPLEILACGLIGSPIVKALQKLQKRM